MGSFIKKTLKFLSIGFVLLIPIIWMSSGPISEFLRGISPNRDFFHDVVLQLPNANKEKKALIIGAEIADYHGLFQDILDKNYDVIAYDTELLLWKVFFTKNFVKSHDSFPQIDLVFAPYVLPFFVDFDSIWKAIIQHLKPNGYFIGTFFVDDPLPDVGLVRHNKEQIDTMFKDFVVLRCDEKKERGRHVIYIFAQKK